MKPVENEVLRPHAVIEITRVLITASLFFVIIGTLLAFRAASVFSNGRAFGPVCIGAGLVIFGIANALVALAFYLLRPWAYPIVKLEVGGFWGFNFAIPLGFHRKIRSLEVRRAFGLVPEILSSEPNTNGDSVNEGENAEHNS